CGDGGNGFVTKLNAAGTSLVYSTYLGGAYSSGRSIAVDVSGNAVVAGLTSDLILSNPMQTFGGGSYDAFVTKLNAAGTRLVYSTYLGGSNFDEATGIALDEAGNAYVTGVTSSTNFFTTTNAVGTSAGGSVSTFAAKFTDPDGPMPLT